MSTIEIEDLVEAGRAASLTSSVIDEFARKGTPKQREFLYELLMAEQASRTASRIARLLRAAKLPAVKTLNGYDFTAITFPTDYGREQLSDLDFLNHAQDLILFGDVGTGKTHLATPLAVAACQRGIPAKFFTTAGLVMQLRRAKDEGRLDKELAAIAKNQLLVIDEFGDRAHHHAVDGQTFHVRENH